MKKIDLIYQCIKKLDVGQGVSTLDLCNELDLERTNVSKLLNKLVKDNRISKSTSRPVKYFLDSDNLSSKAQSSLSKLSNLYPSLSQAVKLAQTAIIYPPNGMNCLVTGDTGVGKSMLAKLIYEYATIINSNKSMPFIHFNCSDYSSNNQLLSAQLFGVKKGTFTGATEDRKGLIEEADGGILFLDEIHNLSKEGQEMLFIYMDTGYFKPLGEVSKKIKSSAKIICATNKDVNESLLSTFTRRIPLTINLPSLKERSKEERLSLIESFLIEEVNKLALPIYISSNVMTALLAYDCPYNIGQLKNDITLVVANAYSSYFINNKKYMKINSPDLPTHISIALTKETKEEQELISSLNCENGYFIYSKDSKITNPEKLKHKNKLILSFKKLISCLLNGNKNNTLSKETLFYLINQYESDLKKELNTHNFNFRKKVFDEIEYKFLETDSSLGLEFLDSLEKDLLLLHLDLIYDRIGSLDQPAHGLLTYLLKEYPEEFENSKNLKVIIEDVLNINLSPYEFIFLVIYYLKIRQL